MLFPRCIRRRLCCALLHEFHTTRPYLHESLVTFQIDPITAHAVIIPKPSSRHSQSKSHSQKTKTPRTGKQSKEKSDRMGCFSDSDTLSSRLQRHKRFRDTRTIAEAELTGPCLAGVLSKRLSPQSAPMEREVHLGASENRGESSSYPSHVVPFHLLPSTVRPQRQWRKYTSSTLRRWRNSLTC